MTQSFVQEAHRKIMEQLHLVFLVLFGPMTFAFCFLTPPMQPNDESAHLMRSVELSGGEIIGQRPPGQQGGGQIPTSVVPFLTDPHFSTDFYALGTHVDVSHHSLKDLLDAEWGSPDTFASFSYVIYPPSSYFAPTLGLILCRWLHVGVVDSFYVGRLFAGILGLWFAAWAIKCLDTGKLFAFSLLCLPEVGFLRGSYSHDAAIIAYAALAVGLLARWLQRVEKRSEAPFDRQQTILLGAGAVLLSFVIAGRPPYFPLAFLFALCAWFASRHHRFAVWIALGLVGLIALYPAVWFVWIHDLRHRNEYGFDNAAQVHFLLHHPEKFPGIFFRTLEYAAPLGYQTSMMGIMGSRAQFLPFWCYATCGAILILAPLHDLVFCRRRFPMGITALAAALLFATIVVLHVYAYIFGSPNHAEMIGGVWGRYFVPIFLFVSLFLGIRQVPWKPGLAALTLVVLSIGGLLIVNTTSILTVMNDYYYFR
jgi:uncharacterized membrane protein